MFDVEAKTGRCAYKELKVKGNKKKYIKSNVFTLRSHTKGKDGELVRFQRGDDEQ